MMGSREQQFHEECSWYEWHNTLVQSIPPLTQEEYATCIVRLFFEPLMDTNGHEWAKAGGNHENHETHENPCCGHVLNH